MAQILEGKSIRDLIRATLSEKIASYLKEGKLPPTLVIVQVGNNPASNVFIKMKKDFGESIGAKVIHKRFPDNASQKEIKDEVSLLNKDKTIHGIIIQLPIPDHLNKFELLEMLDPSKDTDGLHSKNKALGFLPATTRGIMTLISHYHIQIRGKRVLVIGRSELVGIPTALAFLKKDATVTVAHSKTENLNELCKNSDIIVAAVGRPNFIGKKMVREGQIIIDVGITNQQGKVVGDVDYIEVFPIVDKITPVPGGIGPLTVASLFENLLDLYEASR